MLEIYRKSTDRQLAQVVRCPSVKTSCKKYDFCPSCARQLARSLVTPVLDLWDKNNSTHNFYHIILTPLKNLPIAHSEETNTENLNRAFKRLINCAKTYHLPDNLTGTLSFPELSIPSLWPDGVLCPHLHIIAYCPKNVTVEIKGRIKSQTIPLLDHQHVYNLVNYCCKVIDVRTPIDASPDPVSACARLLWLLPALTSYFWNKRKYFKSNHFPLK